jgi:Flp pilus assembly protein TadB
VVTALLVAGAMTRWFPPIPALGAALVWSHPVVAAPLIGGALLLAVHQRRRYSRPDQVAVWLRTAASELRAGHSLRNGVIGACRAVPELGLGTASRLASAGRPLDEVAGAIIGVEGMSAAAATLVIAGRTGGSVVPALEALMGEAVDEAALERERHTSTAQARLSIAIVGGFPVAVLATQIARGEIGHLLTKGPVAVALVLIGVALLIGGLVTVGVLMRRVHR